MTKPQTPSVNDLMRTLIGHAPSPSGEGEPAQPPPRQTPNIDAGAMSDQSIDYSDQPADPARFLFESGMSYRRGGRG